MNTGRPFLGQQESLNISEEIPYEENKTNNDNICVKEILKEKYKKQEDIENQSIVLEEIDIKRMLQYNKSQMEGIRLNHLTETANELSTLTRSFHDFLKKMLLYFLGFSLTSSLVLMTILCYLAYDLSNIIIYCSFIIWSCLNFMNFMFLHYKKLPKSRKMFEILENFAIILMIVYK